MRFWQRVLLLCGLVAWSASSAAVTVRDPTGDGGAYDVTALTVTVQGGTATFTIAYARDAVNRMGGVGGAISIDADHNPQTGAPGSPGFDCRITFKVSKLAPTAQLDYLAGPNVGSSKLIGAGQRNGTRLAFTARSVTLVVPLQMLGTNGDFGFALFQQGQFGVGQTLDRVPDRGVANSRTGQVAVQQVPGGQAPPRTLREQAAPGKTVLVESVTTSTEGGNAIFDIRTRADLPTGALDFQGTMTFSILIDSDRRLETSIEATNVPFLPFGPDRKVRVSLMASAEPTIELITGAGLTGNRHGSGGAGINDAVVQCERRRARIVVPLAALGVRSTAFDWMLKATRGITQEQGQLFLGTSVAFDTGALRRPIAMPLTAQAVLDPRDASVKTLPAAGQPAPVVPIHNLPNSELRQFRGALTGPYLIAMITYENNLVPQPQYSTLVTVVITTATGPRRILIGINWHYTFGPQCIILPDERAGGPAPGAMLGKVPQTPTLILAHACVASRGKNAFLLLPARVLGVPRFTRANVLVETRQIEEAKGVVNMMPKKDPNDPDEEQQPTPTYRATPKPSLYALDWLPNQGVVQLQAR